MFPLIFFVCLFVANIRASPLLIARQSITTLSTSQISPFKPYSYFASAGYCNPSTTSTWSSNCEANPGFETTASGGDGDDVQYWFVGYNPLSDEVIVSHQGTDTADLMWLCYLPNWILRSSQEFLARSKFTSDSPMNRQSAAITLLDSVYLPLHLPTSTIFTTICYGLPRVGNQNFANYIDAHSHLTHINNKKDPIPILPGEFLGFVHPTGEIHIQSSGDWDACPGQDNPSDLCIVGDVPNIFEGDESDHDGPYDGVDMGC
ncbi:hypothetical protein D0Z07_7714 [Hyphodiscus hymeniophilus]|uniref:Fungal lipase-type domain-containing protein n=1 Tax=Hyphodiscus hymeniophilus TaxID=353542 RepID=A0A9P6SKJ9_9HELO|nr:hypothetical protein D0Z07_7714 [Hyphodiscus hymeniophilus]